VAHQLFVHLNIREIKEKTMATVKINGMSCQHCVASVTKAIEDVSGVSEVSVNLEKGEATYDGDVSEQDVKDAIVKVGFEAP
jgi:copper chaperone